MGTGIVSALLNQLPYNSHRLGIISVVFFILKILFSIGFFVISVIRYVKTGIKPPGVIGSETLVQGDRILYVDKLANSGNLPCLVPASSHQIRTKLILALYHVHFSYRSEILSRRIDVERPASEAIRN